MDWGHALLTESERLVFRRLSVFVGGWTLEAAEDICSDGEATRPAILHLIARLVDKSLVVAEERGQVVRYRLLETIRQYSAAKLNAAGGTVSLRRRHADWYLALAEAAEPALTGPDQGIWSERLEIEHDNLRAALRWATESGDTSLGLRLVL